MDVRMLNRKEVCKALGTSSAGLHRGMTQTDVPISGGWIKLYRQVVEHGWLQNHILWAFWCYCLIRANHKKTTAQIGFQRVELEAGQFIFGRKKAAEDLKLSEQQVRTCLKNLSENLTIKSTSKYSIITIINWHTYQSDEIDQPAR